MGRHPSLSSISRSDTDPDPDCHAELDCPFGRLDTLGRSDLRETAYEIFFMSCRSSPGFGGGSRSPLNYLPSSSSSPWSAAAFDGGSGSGGEGSPKWGPGMSVPNSRIKKVLGLKARRSSPMRTGMTRGLNSPGKLKRPMTSAEIMRLQMRVTEHSDHRLRKTLMRTLVGQMGRRAETIILPLELLRQLKPSEFNDAREYHQWQRRQLKILEATLLLYPSLPVDRQNPAAIRLLEIVRAGEIKPIDTSKNSEVMRNLCNSVVALAWRSSGGASTEVCHWADGYPLNVHLYLALLHSIFDLREETVVLDEVDELVELMKKTWPSLGINRMIHNVCFAWLFFKHYIETGQNEPDLMCAAVTMLTEVANDAKKPDLEANYVRLVSAVLVVMQRWAERRVLDYHECFDKETTASMEHILSLAVSTAKIIGEDLCNSGMVFVIHDGEVGMNPSGNRVDYYIKSSIRSAFTKILENGAALDESMTIKADDEPRNILVQLASDTEELAVFEKDAFSPVLRKWHPLPTAAAMVAIHGCFGIVLKQYLAKVTSLTTELVRVLQSAGKLEKLLVQMLMEDSADCEDGGKEIVRQMVAYEVDSVVANLLKNWMEERLSMGKEFLNRAKETETWMPRSKKEPYAQSAVDLMKLAKVTVDEFFEIPLGVRDAMVQDLADGLQTIFQEYTEFIGACGIKQRYVPSLPPLTRCNQDSKFIKLWKKTACRAGAGLLHGEDGPINTGHQRPSTSRGTQRLYIRLNTLHFLIANLHALDKSLAFFSRGSPSPSPRLGSSNRRFGATSSHFDPVLSSAQYAIQYVSEVAAYRLIFLDSRHLFYDGLYVHSVTEARMRPGLRILKHNLTLLASIVTERAHPLVLKEVMKASFEAFLMVLLAGGSERAFAREDSETVLDDFRGLKRVFSTCGEEEVGREGEVVEGIVTLMGLPTERLIEDFSIAACEASGVSVTGVSGDGVPVGTKVPMPPTTGRWNRADPNTVLRVLCHRDDELANQFLKRTFDLAKRR
ncbi:protein unc-13 homolog [Musa acuminata AAA Group]|uniref:protein unc-13 homolog n=1 Tax=Musa acuminata AAA Group TaxID=214697 RepID=UPI0031DF19BB